MSAETDSTRRSARLRALRGGWAIVAIIAALVTAPMRPARAASSPWPMLGHDPRRTGLSRSDAGANIGLLKWKFPKGNGFESSPAIAADGTIYVGSDDGNLYALNLNGTGKWQFATGASVISSPAIGADGTIYVGSEDNNLYAVNPNGSGKWKFTTGDLVHSSPVIGAGETIYVGSNDGNLYAVNGNGREKWAFVTGAAVDSSPSIGTGRTVYVGSEDGNLYAIKPDGSLKWQFTTGNGISSSPAIGADGTVYVGSEDNNLYAVNPIGSQKWQFATGGMVFGSPAIGSDGTIYVGSDDTKLYAINPDGSEKWEFATGGVVESSPAISADGTVYVESGFNVNLYAINRDGSEKWQFATGSDLAFSEMSPSPAIGADGTVYLGSSPDGNLYAVGVARAGALRVSTSSIDFGRVGTGTASQTKSFSVRNLGRATLQVAVDTSGLPVPPFKAAIGAGFTPSFTLRYNESKTISVAFTPTQPGTQLGTIILSASDGGITGVNASAIVEAPSLSVPTTLDFGAVKLGRGKTVTLSILNSALGVLTGKVDTSGLKPPFAVVSGGGKFRVKPTEGHGVSIKFAPRALGSFSGTITITSNDPNNPSATVTVQGSGE